MSELIKKLIYLIPVFILIFLAIYLCYSLSIYFFAKKAKLSKFDRVLSFMPIFQAIPYLKTIRVHSWKMLYLLIPIVNIFILLVWEMKTLKQFKAKPFLVFLLFIPVLNVIYIFLRLYFSISPRHQSKIKIKKNTKKQPEINSYYDIYGNKKTFNKCYLNDIILDEDFELEYNKYKKCKI